MGNKRAPSASALQIADLVDRGQNQVVMGLLALLRILPYRWRIPLGGWAMRAVIAPFAGYGQRVRANLANILGRMWTSPLPLCWTNR